MEFIVKVLYFYLIVKAVLAMLFILFDIVTSPTKIEYKDDF